MICLGYFALLMDRCDEYKDKDKYSVITLQLSNRLSSLPVNFHLTLTNKHEQYIYASLYQLGIGGIEINYNLAFQLCQLSANQELPLAECSLGFYYDNGYGVEKNEHLATKYYLRSAQKGYSIALYNVGAQYYNGESVRMNEEEAIKWIKLSADQGYLEGIYLLGAFYRCGQVVKKDRKEALRYLNQGVLRGSVFAKYQASLCYYFDSKEEEEEEITSNYEIGFKYLTELYSSPYTRADEVIYHLGMCYEYGIGCQIDQNEAFKLYCEASTNGFPLAIYALGRCCEERIGIDENLEEAQRLYEIAVERKVIEAEVRLKEYEEDKVKIRMTFRHKYES